MDKPNRNRWKMRLALTVIGGGALVALISLMEDQRPLRELERAGASIVRNADGAPRTISFSSADAGDEHLWLMSKLKSVRSINLGRSKVTADGVRSLSKLPNLQSLDLSETDHGAGILEVVSGFGALRTLQLRRCHWVTDDSLEHLLQLETLECLMIIDAPMTDRGLKTLAELKNLKQLGLDDCSGVTDDGLRQFAKQSRLESLSVNGCANLSDVGIRHLATMPSLTLLSASGIPMRRSALREIVADRPQLAMTLDRFDFPDLQPLIDAGARIGLDSAYEVRWIEIDDRKHDPHVMSPFSLAGHPAMDVAIREVESQPFEPSAGFLDALQSVPELSMLHLRSVPVRRSGLKVISQLGQLQQLILDQVDVTDDDVGALADCDPLEVLWLRRVPVTGEGVAALSGLPRLTELSLLTDRLTQAGIDAATSLHNLDTLAIGDVSQVSAAAPISRMPKLSNLAMVRATMTAEDMQLLATSPSLQQLQLLHASLPNDALLPLAEMAALKSLYLARCDFNRDSLVHLSDERPDLHIFGTAELTRLPRGTFLPDHRRLLGGIPLLIPAAPTAIH